MPFGFSYTALRISTAVVALFGLWAVYALSRDVGRSRAIALAAAAALGVSPFFFQLSNSFMTDVPFAALGVISLALLVRGFNRDDRGLIAGAFTIALASILLRQFGLILVLSYGLALVVRARGSLKSIAILIGALAFGIAMHLAFQHWLFASGRTPFTVIKSVADIGPGMNRVLITMSVTGMLLLLPYVGAMLAPIYIATGFGSTRAAIGDRPRMIRAVIGFMLLLQVAAVINRHFHFPDWGSHLFPWGMGPMMLHDGYILFTNAPPALSDWIWFPVWGLGMAVAAGIGADLVAATADFFGRLRRRQTPSALDTAVLAFVLPYGALLGLMMIRPGVFDRYLLLLIAPLALLCLARGSGIARPRWALPIAGVVLALTAWFSVTATHDFIAFQRARLAATDTLQAAGVPRTSIDGGYEYNGRYLNRPDFYPNWYFDHGLPMLKSWWWVSGDDYVIASGPIGGYAEQRSFPYYRWLTFSWSRVVILHRLPGSKGEATNLPRKPRPKD